MSTKRHTETSLQPAETKVAALVNGKYCPRCNGLLRRHYYEEPACIVCGYADYSFTEPIHKSQTARLMESGTEYLLRYSGTFPEMKDRLLRVKIVRGGGAKKVRNQMPCPFCGKEMFQVSLSGMRKDASEKRYECNDRHKISICTDRSGEESWR